MKVKNSWTGFIGLKKRYPIGKMVDCFYHGKQYRGPITQQLFNPVPWLDDHLKYVLVFIKEQDASCLIGLDDIIENSIGAEIALDK